MSSKRQQLTYQLLRLPDPAAGLPDGWTEIGTFRPADHQVVVEALSEHRVRGIMRLLAGSHSRLEFGFDRLAESLIHRLWICAPT